MVNRKRAPWWNRKCEVPPSATTSVLSRRAKFLSGTRTSVESVNKVGDVSSTPTDDNGNLTPKTDKDNGKKNDVSVSDGSTEGMISSEDVTPTRDEQPVWKVIDKTDDMSIVKCDKQLKEEKVPVSHYEGGGKGNTRANSSYQLHDAPKPSSSSSAGHKWSLSAHYKEESQSADDDLKDYESKSKLWAKDGKKSIKKRKMDRYGSPESNRSVNTASSDNSGGRSVSPPNRREEKNRKHHKRTEGERKHRHSSRSDSEGQEKTKRKPRPLGVNYDKLRKENGTALPTRTYDPLDPLGLRYGGRQPAKTYVSKNTFSSHKFENYTKTKYSKWETHETSSSDKRKGSVERSSRSTHSSDRSRSSSHDIHSASKSSSKYSSVSSKDSGNKSFTHLSSSSSSVSRHSSRLSRTKSVFSSHVKKSTITNRKGESHSDRCSWMKVNTDGVGIQKIRYTQLKTFLSTCVEDYSLQTNGSMGKEVKPLLAFKIGNPQFVSEFYEKKMDLGKQTVDDPSITQKIMREKFAFKVKIGIDKLDRFITEGITVSGQNTFFSQFRNPPLPSSASRNSVLLYRYADICLAWTYSKNLPKSTPIFLLIHKVVYGRAKTYKYLAEDMNIQRESNCDCLKASLSGMKRKDPEDNLVRKGLACSKVIIADFDDKTGSFRDRPRQVLPYAIVLYGRNNLSEEAQADLKQGVLEWKKSFEMQRWKMATEELTRSQQMMMQQNAMPVNSNLVVIPDLPNPDIPKSVWPPMPMSEPPPMLPPGIAASVPAGGLLVPPQPPMNPHLMMQRVIESQNVMSQPIASHSVLTAACEAQVSRGLKSLREESQKSPAEQGQRPGKRPRFNSVSEDEPSISESTKENATNDAELERLVSEAVATHRRSIQTRDMGVQVKTQSTILSLQRKAVSLSASTQTPDLDRDDSYEASLLRGGPLAPPSATCARCKSSVSSEPEVQKPEVVRKMFVNRSGRKRQYSSLSSRFAMPSQTSDKRRIVDDELLMFDG